MSRRKPGELERNVTQLKEKVSELRGDTKQLQEELSRANKANRVTGREFLGATAGMLGIWVLAGDTIQDTGEIIGYTWNSLVHIYEDIDGETAMGAGIRIFQYVTEALKGNGNGNGFPLPKALRGEDLDVYWWGMGPRLGATALGARVGYDAVNLGRKAANTLAHTYQWVRNLKKDKT